MLLRITPAPGTSTPEPEPFEQVTLAHIPSPSSTEMWVVEPSRSAVQSARRAGSPPALAVRASAKPRRGRRSRPPSPRPAAPGRCLPNRSNTPRLWAIRVPPDEGGGLVSTSAPRKGTRIGAARDRLVGGEVRGPERAAVLDHELGERRRDLAAVERLGPLGAEPFQRLGQLREAEHVAFAQRPAPGRVELPGALEPGVDRGEDVEDVGLLGVDRRPLAGQPDRRADELAERHRAEAARARARARPRCPGTPQEAGPT